MGKHAAAIGSRIAVMQTTIGEPASLRPRRAPAPDAGEIHWTVAETAQGPVLVAANARGICRLAFGEGEAELRARFPAARLVEASGTPLLAAAIAACDDPAAAADLPLDLHGTAFQKAVWGELRRIPPGETRSYGQIATAAGRPGAGRAVGQANGANPVAVLVPCHRVINADGNLGGYSWGLEIKRRLLARERGQTAEIRRS
jgi:AraC family transcriptional regulator, regulatory protein of adaptative response / methylated-DNA-[protein]-cysteine methyltransferase